MLGNRDFSSNFIDNNKNPHSGGMKKLLCGMVTQLDPINLISGDHCFTKNYCELQVMSIINATNYYNETTVYYSETAVFT